MKKTLIFLIVLMLACHDGIAQNQIETGNFSYFMEDFYTMSVFGFGECWINGRYSVPYTFNEEGEKIYNGSLIISGDTSVLHSYTLDDLRITEENKYKITVHGNVKDNKMNGLYRLTLNREYQIGKGSAIFFYDVTGTFNDGKPDGTWVIKYKQTPKVINAYTVDQTYTIVYSQGNVVSVNQQDGERYSTYSIRNGFSSNVGRDHIVNGLPKRDGKESEVITKIASYINSGQKDSATIVSVDNHISLEKQDFVLSPYLKDLVATTCVRGTIEDWSFEVKGHYYSAKTIDKYWTTNEMKEVINSFEQNEDMSSDKIETELAEMNKSRSYYNRSYYGTKFITSSVMNNIIKMAEPVIENKKRQEKEKEERRLLQLKYFHRMRQVDTLVSAYSEVYFSKKDCYDNYGDKKLRINPGYNDIANSFIKILSELQYFSLDKTMEYRKYIYQSSSYSVSEQDTININNMLCFLMEYYKYVGNGEKIMNLDKLDDKIYERSQINCKDVGKTYASYYDQFDFEESFDSYSAFLSFKNKVDKLEKTANSCLNFISLRDKLVQQQTDLLTSASKYKHIKSSYKDFVKGVDISWDPTIDNSVLNKVLAFQDSCSVFLNHNIQISNNDKVIMEKCSVFKNIKKAYKICASLYRLDVTPTTGTSAELLAYEELQNKILQILESGSAEEINGKLSKVKDPNDIRKIFIE